MARLTYEKRKREPKSDFAIPSKKTKGNPAGKGGYPIPDEAHGRSALSRVSRFGTSQEQAIVRRKVHEKFPSIGRKGKK